MRIKAVEVGIHTFELYARDLKYHEVQKVIDRLVEKRKIQQVKRDPYNIDRQLKSTYLIDHGIRLRIHQSHSKSNGIGFILNPSTLLSESYEPVKLFSPTQEKWSKIMDALGDQLLELGLGVGPDSEYIVPLEDLSLSQMDLTMNIHFDSDTDLTALIRLFWKSAVPRHFKRMQKMAAEMKPHCFIAKTRGVVIKAYDKGYELRKNGRCPSKLKDKRILRVEVSLKREAFLKKLELDKRASQYTMLSKGCQQAEEIILSYLRKLFPSSGRHSSYQKTKKTIEKEMADGPMKEQMLFLIQKTSDGAGLDTAIQKRKERYGDIDARRLDRLWRKFDELDINPITLLNGSTEKQIPALIRLLNDM